MALDLGTLTGYLDLDDKKYEGVLDALPGKLKLSGAGMKLAAGAVAVGVGAALVGGIQQGVELDEAQHKITAQLGLTAEESARIGEIAGKLYADAYGESVEDVNTAVQNVVSSIGGMRDASSAAIEDMTAKALNFGTAFEVDTARSTQVVGQLIKGGLVKDANEGFDLLAAAMQRVPAGVREDILDAADEYGPFFAQLGISGEDAMSKLVSAADKGMYGIDKTGDAVKEFSIRATDMSTASKAAYDALGVSQEDMTRKLLAGGDEAAGAFEQIVSGLRGIQDPAAQSQAALALFGTPLEDLGTGEIPAFLAGLQETTGALGEVDGTMAQVGQTLSGSAATGWKDLTRTWDQIVGQVGGALLPVLNGLLSWLNDNPVMLQIAAAAVGLLSTAILGLNVTIWAMNTALLANPITWIVLGIMALVAAVILLVANWDSVVSFLSDVWGGFISWFTGVMDGFLSWWGGLWDGLMTGIQDGWNAVVTWFQGIPGAIEAFFAGVGEWLLDIGRMLLEGLATGIALQFIAIHYLFTQFPTDLLNWLAGAGEWLMQTGLDLLTGLGLGIITGYNAVAAFFQALPGYVLAFLVSAASWLVQTGLDLLNGLAQGITTGWNAVVAFFQAMPGQVLSFLASAGSWLVSTGHDLLAGLRSGLDSFWGNIAGFFQALPGNVVSFFSGIGSWLYSAGRDLINGLLNGVKSLAGTIGSFFLSLLPDWIVGPFKAALGIASPSKVFRGYGRNIVEGIGLGLSDRQSALDQQMAALVGAQDYSAGSALVAGMSGSQAAQQAPVKVSLEGARLRLIVGEQEFDGYVDGRVLDASEQQRSAVINGAGGVVFS